MPRLLPYRLLALAALLPAVVPAAQAQRFNYGGARESAGQALYVGVYGVHFTFDGAERPSPSFEFENPVYGVVFTRPSVYLALGLGTQAGVAGETDDLRLVDATFMVWGELNLLRQEEARRTFVYVPIVLHSGYRRVSRQNTSDDLLDAFDVGVLGLGTGLGVRALGRGWAVEARATPILGLALRSFGGSTGTSRMLDTDLQLHFGPLFDRYGLSLGFGYRLQAWDVGGSDAFGDLTRNFFDYSGNQWLARLGVNW